MIVIDKTKGSFYMIPSDIIRNREMFILPSVKFLRLTVSIVTEDLDIGEH